MILEEHRGDLLYRDAIDDQLELVKQEAVDHAKVVEHLLTQFACRA